MSFLQQALDLFLHLDVQLANVIAAYGPLTYALLFVIIFCETGLVVAPFLPGDSLLFAAGAFAARGSLSLPLLAILFIVAAIGGDAVNYLIGAYVGPRVFLRWRLLKQEHLDKAHAFFERHGGKAIVFARFVPIVRTVAPFVAGVGRMTYRHFATYNVTGGLIWVTLFLGGGYLFGNIPAVEKNFSVVILVIIVISVLPGVVEYWRGRRRRL
jgi:membrane-associated protein